MELTAETITETIIERLTALLSMKAIYIIPHGKKAEKQLFLILMERDGNIDNELNLLAHVFQDYDQYVYRIYREDYAIRQLKGGNIFFLQGLSKEYLRYGFTEISIRNLDDEKALQKAEVLFKKEFNKALNFQKGADFYIDKGVYSEAAFMLHQAMELAFRTIELIAMGREKISHKLKAHQKYVRGFVPELGALFSPKNEKEARLLGQIDKAYRDVRYDRDYKISSPSIELMQYKLKKMLGVVEEEFALRLDFCKKLVQPTPFGHADVRKIRKITDRELRVLRLNPSTLYDKTAFKINGMTDILYDISGMIKVCICALEYGDRSCNKLIPQPHMNIQRTLEYILQLLPLDEMEILEEIVNVYGNEEIKSSEK